MEQPYPSKAEIAAMFSDLANGNTSALFSQVSPQVDWEVIGNTPCSGHFKTLSDWQAGALGPINAVLRDPIQVKVRNIIGGGDEEWAAVELQADSVLKNGKKYDQKYTWVLRFDESGTIVQVRAYLDTQLVQMAIDENK